MDENTFKQRTKQLALSVIKLIEVMPKSVSAATIARQVSRSSMSIGANYRAACRAKSTADMINKLKTVEEESDETIYWLELIVGSDMVPENRVKTISKEAGEILAMTVASLRTLRNRKS